MGLTYPGVQFLELSGEQFRSTVPAELYSAGIVLNPFRHRDKISIPIAQVTSIRHVNLQAPEKTRSTDNGPFALNRFKRITENACGAFGAAGGKIKQKTRTQNSICLEEAKAAPFETQPT